MVDREYKFPESIKSRPVYGTLELRPGPEHLFIADAHGAQAIIALANHDGELIASAQILYIPKDVDLTDQLDALSPTQLHIAPSYGALLPHIQDALKDAKMGLQLYLAGSEGLIGQAESEALKAGVAYSAIQTEHRGSTARRMQCVHCKGITEDVATDPFICSNCGLTLLVRDHYSRRLAAFQGVRVDAEDPGNVPAMRGLYE